MRRFLQVLVLVPLAVLLIVFAVANREAAVLSLDPFSPDDPALAMRIPLYLVVFGALLVGVLVGGISTWVSQGHWRSEARGRRAEARRERARAAEAEARYQEVAAPAPGLPAPGTSR